MLIILADKSYRWGLFAEVDLETFTMSDLREYTEEMKQRYISSAGINHSGSVCDIWKDIFRMHTLF